MFLHAVLNFKRFQYNHLIRIPISGINLSLEMIHVEQWHGVNCDVSDYMPFKAAKESIIKVLATDNLFIDHFPWV